MFCVVDDVLAHSQSRKERKQRAIMFVWPGYDTKLQEVYAHPVIGEIPQTHHWCCADLYKVKQFATPTKVGDIDIFSAWLTSWANFPLT